MFLSFLLLVCTVFVVGLVDGREVGLTLTQDVLIAQGQVTQQILGKISSNKSYFSKSYVSEKVGIISNISGVKPA